MTTNDYHERFELPADGADDATLRDFGRQLAIDTLILDALHGAKATNQIPGNIIPIDPAGRRGAKVFWTAAAVACAACLIGFIGYSVWTFPPRSSGTVVNDTVPEVAIAEPAEVAKPENHSITIKLPVARFIGTPKPIKDPSLPHLEKLQEHERLKELTIAVPSGTRLLSKGRPVTATAQPIDGELEMITDGDMDAEQYCDVGIGTQSVTVDLGAEHDISAVVFWHFHENARAFHDVVIEIGTDPDFVKKSTVLYNADHDSSLGKGHGKGTDTAYVETNEGRVVMGRGTKGRYVRLWSRGSNADEFNYYTEIQVYGK